MIMMKGLKGQDSKRQRAQYRQCKERVTRMREDEVDEGRCSGVDSKGQMCVSCEDADMWLESCKGRAQQECTSSRVVTVHQASATEMHSLTTAGYTTAPNILHMRCNEAHYRAPSYHSTPHHATPAMLEIHTTAGSLLTPPSITRSMRSP